MELFIDAKNYKPDGSVFHRAAARAILQKGNLYLFVSTKSGEYKFPGGGVEHGESLEEAVLREVREETGYLVLPASLRKCGVVHEKRKGSISDILEMDSHYFFGVTDPVPGKRQLDSYEAEEEYQAEWVSLQTALEQNAKVFCPNARPWILRDTVVIEALLQENIPPQDSYLSPE